MTTKLRGLIWPDLFSSKVAQRMSHELCDISWRDGEEIFWLTIFGIFAPNSSNLMLSLWRLNTKITGKFLGCRWQLDRFEVCKVVGS